MGDIKVIHAPVARPVEKVELRKGQTSDPCFIIEMSEGDSNVCLYSHLRPGETVWMDEDQVSELIAALENFKAQIKHY